MSDSLRRGFLAAAAAALLAGGLSALASAPALAGDAAPGPSPSAEYAIPLDDSGSPLWRTRVWRDFPVRIELADLDELRRLLAVTPIASFQRDQIRFEERARGRVAVFEPRVTAEELAALRASGLDPLPLPDLEREGREAAEREWRRRSAGPRDGSPRDPSAAADDAAADWTYHTHQETGQLLADIAAAHPDIARTYVWGTSIEGRELWGIAISDSVGIEQAEPEVRLSGTIHGNEPIGLELLLELARLLTDSYGVDPRITDLVDNREIHILPLHNPDGYAWGSRYNYYDVDLNRDFPVPTGGIGQERENVAFMDHGRDHCFVLSANFHSGALVVNYPWDYTFDLAPDDDALIELSLEYSSRNPPMYASPSFSHGITNGAAWYVAWGSLQDWSYERTGCIDLTVELSDVKWPQASALAGLWDDNRESMLALIEAAGWGVGGTVTDSDTGLPVAATVSVAGNAATVDADPDRGDYRKLLPPGTWDLQFSAEGYQSLNVGSVATTWGEGSVLDVTLDPLPRGTISGTVEDTAGDPVAASVRALRAADGSLAAAAVADSSAGAFALTELPYAEYVLAFAAAGHLPDTLAVLLDGSQADGGAVLQPVRAAIVYADDFESHGVDDWQGDWLLTVDAGQGERALCDSPLGSYGTSMTSVCALREVIDLSLYDFASVSFLGRWSLEPDYDCVRLELSGDGGASWTPLAGGDTRPGSGMGVQVPAGVPCFDGDPPDWRLQTFDLTPWAGLADVRLRFVLQSDEGGERDGFFCDDFRVEAGVFFDPVTDTPPRAVARLARAYPNPFNPSVAIEAVLPRAGRARITIHDARGRLVRTLLDRDLPAGATSVGWDGRDGKGAAAAAGVYLVRLSTADGDDSAKVVMVR